MHTAHEIDTALASDWKLIGRPVAVDWRVFVQRSHMRGRPWLRFFHKISSDGYWVTAYKTRKEAVRG